MLVIILAVAANWSWAGQNNSLYQRGAAMRAQTAGNADAGVEIRQGTGGHSRESFMIANWLTVQEPTPRNVQVHDLVSIIIHEVSKHSTKADTKTERETTVDFTLSDWVRLNGGNLRPDKQLRGDPKINGSFARDFEGKGDVTREDQLTARIQAEVIDVLPNGNLVLEATQSIVTEDESSTITLTGLCRSKDVGPDNTIMSSQVYNLKIKKEHSGTAHNATKQGFIMKLLDYLNPF